MLQLTPQSVIFVASKHVDFRKGIDGLAAICKQQLALDPMTGSLFLFFNRLKTTIKILLYDGQGFILFIKRLSKGKFSHNFQLKPTDGSKYSEICYRSLLVLINNGDIASVNFSKNWKNPQTKA